MNLILLWKLYLGKKEKPEPMFLGHGCSYSLQNKSSLYSIAAGTLSFLEGCRQVYEARFSQRAPIPLCGSVLGTGACFGPFLIKTY